MREGREGKERALGRACQEEGRGGAWSDSQEEEEGKGQKPALRRGGLVAAEQAQVCSPWGMKGLERLELEAAVSLYLLIFSP